MATLPETDATPASVASAIRVAAALSAGSSLLHWIATDTDTHAWSGEAIVSLVAGAALMGLAMVLAARPWSPPTARTIYLVGAVGVAVVVVAFLLPILSEITSGHAGGDGHPGHDVGGGEAIATVRAIRTAGEVVLIGLLAWLHRMTAPPAVPRITGVSG